jgi:hypothetical protein
MVNFTYKAKRHHFEKDPIKREIEKNIDQMDNENLWSGKAVVTDTKDYASPQQSRSKSSKSTKGPNYKPFDKDKYKKKIYDMKIDKLRSTGRKKVI